MPTIVKERVDPKPEETTRAEALGTIIVLLTIVVVAALLASIFPLSPTVEPATAMFFSP